MNKYSRTMPFCISTSAPAAFADPPTNELNQVTQLHFKLLHTSCNEVVDNDDVLPFFDSTFLHFEAVLRDQIQ